MTRPIARLLLPGAILASVFAHAQTPAATGTFTDERDGTVYRTVSMGSVTVMAESLRFACPESRSFNDNQANDARYGRLYTWPILMAGSSQEGAAGVCPKGWHVPSMGEWILVFNRFGGKGAAGPHVREGGTSGLNLGLFGKYAGKKFTDLGITGLFWTSTKISKGPLAVSLRPKWDMVTADNPSAGDAVYCRCFKD